MCIVSFVGTLYGVLVFFFLNEKHFHKLYNHEAENSLLSEATACGHLLKKFALKWKIERTTCCSCFRRTRALVILKKNYLF